MMREAEYHFEKDLGRHNFVSEKHAPGQSFMQHRPVHGAVMPDALLHVFPWRVASSL